MNCGYDTRTGKSLTTAVSAAPMLNYATPKKAVKPKDYMAPTGSIVSGIIYSTVAALVTSILWVVVAVVTGYSVGYIAILIGFAAGIGMQAGHKGVSNAGGGIAAGVTFLVIMVAKAVVLQIVLVKDGINVSIFRAPPEALAAYFFNPLGIGIILVGVAAAFRCASGTSK